MQLTPDHIFAGRYRLISKIGMGGFSEVWKVADEMAEDRIMVLKVYAPERGLDEHGIKQFRREYAITLDLNHPNLLKANHFDIADGSPYLVMPLCEGGSLYGRLEDNGPMPERKLAEMLVQVADALEYLHRKEITHQDIKPDNVLIDSEGNYMLMDFGISSRLRSTMQKSTTTAKAMTVAYAPPEKFEGMAKVGPEGDVFSLGVMLVELLTGDLPWSGMGGAYVRPDSKPIQLPTSICPTLTQLIQRCVAFEPAQRPTPKELKEAAERYLSTAHWAVEHKSSGRITEVVTPKSQPEPKFETKPSTNPPINHKKNNSKWWFAGGVLIMALIVLVTAWPSGAEVEEIEPIAENTPVSMDTIVAAPADTNISGKMSNSVSTELDGKPKIPPITPKDSTIKSTAGVTLSPTQKPGNIEEIDWRVLECFGASNGKYGFRHKNTKVTMIAAKYDVCGTFYEGIVNIELNGKWGYIDKTGKQVVAFKYDETRAFSEGLAKVMVNDKWGYMDITGKEVIPLKYDNAREFYEGRAQVYLNGKTGYIDKTGREVIPLKYDFLFSFSEDLARVKLNGKWGFIDKMGEEVIPIKYDDAYDFKEELARVKLNGKWFSINNKGECVKDCP